METITQTDLDNLADIIWWIKGYLAGCEKNYDISPFGTGHIESLRKMRANELDKLNEKESA
jgi:hypothetical protein